MNERLRQYLVTLGLRQDATDEQAWEFYAGLDGDLKRMADEHKDGKAPDPPKEPQRADPPPDPPANAPAPDTEAVRAEAQKAERERIRAIREQAGEVASTELVNRGIDEGWTVEQFSVEMVREIRAARQPAAPRQDAPAGHVRGDADGDALHGAMMIRAGMTRAPANLADDARQRIERQLNQGERFRHLSMVEIAGECVRLMGGRRPYNHHEAIHLAIMLSRQHDHNGWYAYNERTGQYERAVSTSSLTNIFSTSVNASVLEGYTAAVDTTEAWTLTNANLANFMTQERNLVSKGSTLAILPRGGEADHNTFSDAQETYKAARYARQFVVDEQDIIDDRLDVITGIPREMAESAAQLRPDLVYSILIANAALGADSTALFHADHNNLETSSALSAANLRTAVKDVAVQQQDSRNLNLKLAYLIVPQALKHLAYELTNSTQILLAGSTDTERGQLNALLVDGIVPVSDARLDNGVTDPASGTANAGSATTWFAAAGNTRNTIEVGYVRGTGTRPVLRSFTLTEGRFGMGWDIHLDIGAKALDYRGLFKATA